MPLRANHQRFRSKTRSEPLAHLLFSVWIALLLALALPLTWVAVALAPAGAGTHRTVHWCARVLIRLCFCRVRVRGLAHLSATPCAVLVANHASYLDSVVLLAAIPRHCRFVVNHMAARRPLLGLIIRKAGYLVVDRRSWRSRAACSRLMGTSLRGGTSLVLFPEGTRGHDATMLPFHTGAFRAAAKTGSPVIPVAVAGTRHILPRRARLLRRGNVDVHILPATYPVDETPQSANLLRANARRAIEDALRVPVGSPVRVC